MRRSLALVATAVFAAAAVSAIAWPVYGSDAFVSCLAILGSLGAVTTLIGSLSTGGRVWIRGLRRRLALLAGLLIAQLGAAVALFAALMFVSHHDAFFMALAAGYAAIIGLAVARFVTRRALDDLDAVRTAVAEVGEGSRDVRIPVQGGDELALLAADVEAMVARLAGEERARRQLVAAVSHDLRTPITTLRLIADGLEDGIFEPERTREQLRLISTHVGALSALIDDLFELSRLEAGDIHWSMEQVALDDLVRETIEAMRPHADAGGVAIESRLAGRLAPARGNPEALQRVLFNLIQNAIRHTPADGSVVVRAEPGPGPAIEVEVADTGEGIDAEQRDLVFEPFVQGPAHATTARGSAGLGLAIARAIVQAHGGRIWLAEARRGTRVRFTVPAAADPLAAELSPRSPTSSAPAG